MNSIKTGMEKINLQTSHFEASPKDSENVSPGQVRTQATDSKHLEKNRIVTGFKAGKWLDSYKMLRTRCLQLMDANNWTTLAVTSPAGNSGNSLTAANLALSIAMELDHSALLVDANFQNSSISKLFGIEAETGLSDYLLHEMPLNGLLINPDTERFVILPAGKQMLNSAEMLRSPRMVGLVNELKTRYPSQIAIFDMPPLLSQADTLGFAPYVDCVLLIVDEGHTKTDELKHAATLLKETNVLGTVLNKSGDNKIKYQAG